MIQLPAGWGNGPAPFSLPLVPPHQIRDEHAQADDGWYGTGGDASHQNSGPPQPWINARIHYHFPFVFFFQGQGKFFKRRRSGSDQSRKETQRTVAGMTVDATVRVLGTLCEQSAISLAGSQPQHTTAAA